MTSGIIEILSEDAGVQALVGRVSSNDKWKIFPVRAEQGEVTPYITVYKISNDPLSSLDKDLPSGLDYPRVQINTWSKNFRDTELLFEAVRLALDNKESLTENGYEFSRIWLINDNDGYDDEARLFCHISVFGVELKRSI